MLHPRISSNDENKESIGWKKEGLLSCSRSHSEGNQVRIILFINIKQDQDVFELAEGHDWQRGVKQFIAWGNWMVKWMEVVKSYHSFPVQLFQLLFTNFQFSLQLFEIIFQLPSLDFTWFGTFAGPGGGRDCLNRKQLVINVSKYNIDHCQKTVSIKSTIRELYYIIVCSLIRFAEGIFDIETEWKVIRLPTDYRNNRNEFRLKKGLMI